MTRRRKGRLAAMLLALAAVLSLAACGGPNFDALKDDLKFGDEEISDVMTTYSMKIPQNKPGKLIRSPQYAWANKNQGNAVAAAGSAKVYFVANPSAQCDALNATNSQISDDDASEGSGTWTYVSSTRSCDKQRKLSWLEKTMWTMYEQQSGDTIDWLSTSRNTLVASSGTVSTLQNSVLPMYDAWDTNVNKYLNIAQGVLIVAAAISLMVLAARIVWQIGNGSAGMDGHLLGKIGWIFLGVFMGSSAASIALTFFKQAHMTKTVVNGVPTATAGRSTPALASWTPGSGASFFVSDWVRLQVDPFLIIAAVCGVVAAGFKLITTQEGRELVPLGKAFMWAMLTSVCLAGFVNLFQDTVDTWTAGVLKSASNMMRDSWQHNTLAATEFFNLDWPIALVLTIVVWFCNLISKVFCYLRAGLLPIMVGVAPVWAAMSWMETGRQAFGKVMGWLFAFLFVQTRRRARHGDRKRDHGHRDGRRRQPGHHPHAHSQRHRAPARDDKAHRPGRGGKRRRRRGHTVHARRNRGHGRHGRRRRAQGRREGRGRSGRQEERRPRRRETVGSRATIRHRSRRRTGGNAGGLLRRRRTIHVVGIRRP